MFLSTTELSRACGSRHTLSDVHGCGTLSLSCHEALLCLVPVDDLPHLVEVLWARVLVVQVVSVFPDIDVDDGSQVGAQVRDQILVDGRAELQRVFRHVVRKPAPATALDGGSSLVKHLDELLVAAPASDDGIVERARVRQCTVNLRAEGVPEELVVQVTATVEFNVTLDFEHVG